MKGSEWLIRFLIIHNSLVYSYLIGLKTAVRLASEKLCIERGVESVENLSHKDKADIAASFQHTAFRHLEIRLQRAMELVEHRDGIQTLAVVGGVAANRELRSRLSNLCSSKRWSMCVPPPRLCTDQGELENVGHTEHTMYSHRELS